jgi:transcriptional regulator with XRE-family HTH domain
MDVTGLLRRARQEAMLTQRQLAAQVGIASSTVSRYESGAAQPSLPMLDRMLAACGKQVEATLVHRHGDLDVDLDQLAAWGHEQRLSRIALLTGRFVSQLPVGTVIGGAWAAALHALPHEHRHGTLWVPGDEVSSAALAGLLAQHMAWFYEPGGDPCSPIIRPDRLVQNPVAEWKVSVAGRFRTVLVPQAAEWPVAVRIDGDLGSLQVVPAETLGQEADGVRPDVLARWLERRGRTATAGSP